MKETENSIQPEQMSSQAGQKKKSKISVVLLILILLGGGGYAVWKYVLPKIQGGGAAKTAPMKLPDSASIKPTQQFGEIPINQFGMVLKEELTKSDAEKIAKEAGGTITGELDILNFFQVETQGSTEEEFNKTFAQLKNTNGVELVSPNGLIIPDGFDESKGTCDPLDDPMYKDSAHGRIYDMIGLKDAYGFIKASGLELNPVKVAVMDTRLFKPCDELGTNVSTTEAVDFNNIPAKDSSGAVINDGFTHGTMVTEVIGANAENGGVTGVAAPMGNKLTIETTNIFKGQKYQVSTPDLEDPSKVVSQGVTYVHTTMKAILDQIKNGATVINCSFGPEDYTVDHSFETKLYEKFYKKIQEKYPKVVIISSAGNSNEPLTGTNGTCKGQKVGNLLTVGALDPDGEKSKYSNYATPNAEVSISTPANKMILGMDKNGKPITASGTSLAAPQVAGTVALIQSINPDLTATEIKNILQSSADKIINGRSMSTPIPAGMGVGMLRVDNAILKVINDMRAKKGLKPPLTHESMRDMTKVYLSFTGGPKEYKVKAEIKAISGASTILTMDISGNDYSFSGNNKKTLNRPGEVTWNLTLKNDEKVTVKVSRSDTKSCAWVVIDPVEFGGMNDNILGIYQGNYIMVVNEANMIEAAFDQIDPSMDEETRERRKESDLDLIKLFLENVEYIKGGGQGGPVVKFEIGKTKGLEYYYVTEGLKYIVYNLSNTTFIPKFLTPLKDNSNAGTTLQCLLNGFQIVTSKDNKTITINATFNGNNLVGDWNASYKGKELWSATFTAIKIIDM